MAWVSAVFAIIFNVFVSPDRMKYYIIFVLVLVFYRLSIYFSYSEISGYTLQEMTVVFDKEGAGMLG